MRQVIDFAARRLSVAALTYYRCSTPIMSDAENDALANLVAENWEWLSPFYQDVFESADAIRATTSHIYVSERCYRAALHALRQRGIEADLDPIGFQAEAVWESQDEPGISREIMSLGG